MSRSDRVGEDVSHSLFPVADVERHLRKFLPSVERSDGVLRWASGDGISELSVAPVQKRTSGGLLVSEIVTLTHTSSALAELTPDLIARLNSWSTISSIVPADGSGSARLVAKVGVFSTDREAAERVYAPLLATEAGVSGWHAARIVRGEFRGKPEQSPLHMTNQEPPFDQADFEAIKAITDRFSYFSSLGDRAFTVEFPWDTGAVTNLLRSEEMQERLRASQKVSEEQFDRMVGKTSLLQILVDDHPLYGKGVRSTLELPFSPEDPATLVNELNAWELSAADLPPHFGAWCIGHRAPAYVSFMPTQFCVAGILINLIGWMAVRQARVREWLKVSPSRH